MELDEDRMVLNAVKYMGLNLAALSLKSLHVLHQGVLDELRIREQCALSMISVVKTNNEQIFIEKVQALKEK